MWKKGAVNDEGYFKLTSAYSQELLLTATSAKLLEIKGKTLSTLTGKKIYKKNKCLHYSVLFVPTSTCIWLQVKIFFALLNDLFHVRKLLLVFFHMEQTKSRVANFDLKAKGGGS